MTKAYDTVDGLNCQRSLRTAHLQQKYYAAGAPLQGVRRVSTERAAAGGHSHEQLHKGRGFLGRGAPHAFIGGHRVRRGVRRRLAQLEWLIEKTNPQAITGLMGEIIALRHKCSIRKAA